ncbi:MAG: AraC family transcriptional regulator [Mucilaginibacter sp.]|uniref:AraC family transcriptional regulator n=1 Tax=Mucilaginibacter sp. TaxID=1882438 RepID=UPI0031AC77C1
MKIVKQFKTLMVEDFEEISTLTPVHSHNFFEIIYIFRGNGNHLINHISHPYNPGDLFVLSPEDEHFFEIVEPTRFATIRFTDDYFSDKKHLTTEELLAIRPEDLMRHKLLKEMKLNLDDPCRMILKNTVENILAYNCKTDLSTSTIIFYQVLTILGMIKEEIARLGVHIGKGQPNREALLSFIHQNIYYPEKIHRKNIADHFDISNSYFSIYFKRNFSISYREYVHSYRLQLIEKRLQSNHSTLKEIAHEFGFTDESHLSNYFKQKKKVNPSFFRKEHDLDLIER